MSQTLDQSAPIIDEPLYEVVDGKRLNLPPIPLNQALLAADLNMFLGNFTDNEKLGVVAIELLFLLNREKNLQRRPDVAFVPYSHWPESTVDSSAAWNVVPALAVEFVSALDCDSEISRKINDYFQSGVQLVWVIDPVSGLVSVYDSPECRRRLNRTDTLDGGNVLPGFELPLETLFAVTKRPA